MTGKRDGPLRRVNATHLQPPQLSLNTAHKFALGKNHNRAYGLCMS
jgi:hypothetical protein